ncbi:MAG: glycosyl hydrolase [Bacteroidota bacterium]
MAFSLKRIFILLSLGTLLVLGAWFTYTAWYYHGLASGQSIRFLADTTVSPVPISPEADSLYQANWNRYLPQGLAVEDFVDPPQSMGPWTRWWWPGNRVDSQGLNRDLEMMQRMGFAGAEIYPTQAGIEKGVGEQEKNAYLGYRSPAYYGHITYSLEVAETLGLQLDLNVAVGGIQALDSVAREEQLYSLAFSEADVLGGKRIELELPLPEIPFAYWATAWEEDAIHDGEQNLLDWQTQYAELVAVWAVKTEEESRSDNPYNLSDYVSLNPDSIFEITSFVSRRNLTWEAPGGFWKLIAAYQLPTGQGPAFLPSEQAYQALSPFREQINQKYLNLQLGEAALYPHMGKALRGISWDHLDYLAEHPFPAGLLEAFEAEHGYDLRPFLPVLAKPGTFFPKLQTWKIPTEAAYRLKIGDDRIRRDYLETLTSMLARHHFQASQNWARKRGLMSRLQPYGLPLNQMRLTKAADLPETEQAFGGGSRMFLKMISSSGALHGKRLISGEAGGYTGQAFQDTPARLKEEVDQLFVAGVNHLMWVGTPYRLADPDYGITGWHPYSSPYNPQFNQGVNLSEGNPFWRQLRSLQSYIARVQYVMRMGTPRPETLVYFPFDAFPTDFPSTYTGGSTPVPSMPGPLQQGPVSEATKWLLEIEPLLKALDARGMSWAWVSGDDLVSLEWKNGKLSLYDQSYTSLLLVEPPEIKVEAARNLYDLYQNKAHIYALGTMASRHKGYVAWPQKDAEVESLMQKMAYADAALSEGAMHNFWARFPRAERLSFAETYDFLSLERREDEQGNMYAFLVNQSAEDRHFTLNLTDETQEAFWLNPMLGKVHRAQIGTTGQIHAYLPSHASLILVAGENLRLTDSLISSIDPVWKGQFPQNKSSTLNLDRWDFFLHEAAEEINIRLMDTMLFDWKREGKLEFTKSDALYTTDFFLPQLETEKRYLLDLGSFAGTLDVVLNTDSVTTLLYPPYRLDLTDWLQPGFNTLELWLTPPMRNYLINRGRTEPARYRQWQYDPDSMMSMGLKGPIRIWEVDP